MNNAIFARMPDDMLQEKYEELARLLDAARREIVRRQMARYIGDPYDILKQMNDGGGQHD